MSIAAIVGIVLGIVAGVVVLGLVGYGIFVQMQDRKDQEQKHTDVNKIYADQKLKLQQTTSQLNEIERKLQQKTVELTKVGGQINTAKQQLATVNTNVANQQQWYEAVEQDAKKKMADAQSQYKDLISKGQAQYKDLVDKGQAQYDSLVDQAQLMYNELVIKGEKAAADKIKDAEVVLNKNKIIKEQELEKTLKELQNGISNRTKDIQEIESKLKELSERYNRGLKIEEGVDNDRIEYEYEFAPGEKEFFEVLRKLQYEWKEYAEDFGKIIWGRVMKQIQGWDRCGGNKVLHIKGVYKLTLKENGKVYIGQAKDIYTRWQEHMKKMCGVMACGNEKLYKYGVEDFTWSILESGNIDLNKSEAYWINFYKSDQCGLNSKRGNQTSN